MLPVRKRLREASGQGRWTGFSAPVRRFMADYEASTTPYSEADPHRESRRDTRSHENGVTSIAQPQMDMLDGEREEIALQWLHSKTPNRGHGRVALRGLTKLADKHGVTMTLNPQRPSYLTNHGGPDDAGLERWYNKHGFRMGEYGIMTRHPKRVRESIADALIATRLHEGVVVRASFGDRHSWRKPSETLTANQLSDADVTTWMPDSHHVADRTAGGRSSSTVTFNTRSKRGKVKSTPLLQIKRTATGDGTYRESSTSHPILQRADRRFGNTSDVRVTPHSDEFEVELSRGVLDRTFHEPWSKLFDKYGHNEVFNNYRDAAGDVVSRKLTNDDMKDAVYLRYDNPHAAIHMARTFGGEPGLDVTVRHNRHFSKNGAPPDYNWPESVGTIDYAHDPTPDGKVKYKRSFHAMLDHAKAIGRPHRCGDAKGVPGPARCSGEHPCPSARAMFGTQIGEGTLVPMVRQRRTDRPTHSDYEQVRNVELARQVSHPLMQRVVKAMAAHGFDRVNGIASAPEYSYHDFERGGHSVEVTHFPKRRRSKESVTWCARIGGRPAFAKGEDVESLERHLRSTARRLREGMADTLEKKYGITHREKRTPTSQVCSIGYSDKHKRWHGWSHRAVAGFGVGDGFFPEPPDGPAAVHWSPPKEKDRVKIKTLDQAKQSAKNFAKWVA